MLRQPLAQAARRRLIATPAPQRPAPPPAPRAEAPAQVVQMAPVQPQQG